MSRYVSDTIPEECLRAFDGTGLEEKFGEAHLLVSTDDDGTPRMCMLSAGEIFAAGPKLLRVGLWPNSRTLNNLKKGKRVLFCFIRPQLVLYLKGTPRYIGFDPQDGVERVEIVIDSAESDEHPGMPVTHGIGFSCDREARSAILEHWNKVLAALKKA